MGTETVRMNISIEKDLALTLKKVTSPRKRSSFISDAIRQKLEQQKKQELELLLEEGYKSRCQESLKMSEEFADVDLENWDEY